MAGRCTADVTDGEGMLIVEDLTGTLLLPFRDGRGGSASHWQERLPKSKGHAVAEQCCGVPWDACEWNTVRRVKRVTVYVNGWV